MDTIKNIYKHNTVFKLASSEGRYFDKQENKILLESRYESNEMHNHLVNN